MGEPDTTNKKRPITDLSAIDVIAKLTCYLSTLSTSESYTAPPKQKLSLSEEQQNVEDYIKYGQDLSNCSLNQRKEPIFERIWNSGNWFNFAHKHTIEEPWLFFWNNGLVKIFPEKTYTESAVGCVWCHLASTIDKSILPWCSTSVKNIAQIIKHRTTDGCKRARAVVGAHFRTKTITVCNDKLKETEKTDLKIPLIPFERYQTEIVHHVENQVVSRSFKFNQISVLVKAVRFCLLFGFVCFKGWPCVGIRRITTTFRVITGVELMV